MIAIHDAIAQAGPQAPEVLTWQNQLSIWLQEDLATAGDVTTRLLVPAEARGRARLVTRQSGRLSGLPQALQIFATLDPQLVVTALSEDGQDFGPGQVLAELEGNLRALLTAERTALNLLSRLSGVATTTRQAVRQVEDLPCQICCTRKTTPGLRGLEKYAVQMGGGCSHRAGLHDAILIKDNHIAAFGGVIPVLEHLEQVLSARLTVQIEVETLDQVEEALSAGARSLLLDNMDAATLKQAVERADGQAITEASGGIAPDTLREKAQTGVDFISLGWLTHSAVSIDIGLDLL